MKDTPYGIISPSMMGFQKRIRCLFTPFFLLAAVFCPHAVTYGAQSFGAAPSVTTDPAANVSYNSATLRGTVNANGLSTIAWFQYRSANGHSRNTVFTQTVIGSSGTEVSHKIIELLPGTTYYYRITAKNDAGVVYGNEIPFTTTDMKTYVPTDITPPAGSVNANNGASCTNSPTVVLNLSATDNVGVTGYYLSTSSIPPSSHSTGWTSAPSAMQFRDDVLFTFREHDGKNTVYAWYKDDAGNISGGANCSIFVDTTPPEITITYPTSDHSYTAAGKTITICGSATDTMNEINSVTWSCNTGKNAEGRESVGWIISNVDLQEGANIITVKATDSVGNTGMATITITHTVGNNPPTVITGQATGITTGMATLSGKVNPMGATATAWFQYGTVSGSYTGATKPLDVGDAPGYAPHGAHISELLAGTTYYYRLVAQNSAGVSQGSEMTFNTLPPKGAVYGRIVYSAGRMPVDTARVRLKGIKSRKRTFRVAFSDEKGAFIFDELDADTYNVSAAKIGFMGASQRVSLKEGEERSIEIRLEEKKDVAR